MVGDGVVEVGRESVVGDRLETHAVRPREASETSSVGRRAGDNGCAARDSSWRPPPSCSTACPATRNRTRDHLIPAEALPTEV